MLSASGDGSRPVLDSAAKAACAFFDRMGMQIQMSKCIRMSTSSGERKGFRARVRRGEEGTFTQMQNAMRDLGANLNVTK
eukprot:15446608-Alexandrium_andersonii.AAC.1